MKYIITSNSSESSSCSHHVPTRVTTSRVYLYTPCSDIFRQPPPKNKISLVISLLDIQEIPLNPYSTPCKRLIPQGRADQTAQHRWLFGALAAGVASRRTSPRSLWLQKSVSERKSFKPNSWTSWDNFFLSSQAKPFRKFHRVLLIGCDFGKFRWEVLPWSHRSWTSSQLPRIPDPRMVCRGDMAVENIAISG